MRWSFKLFTVAGIGIYIHITFLLLVGYFFSVYFIQGGGELALEGTALIIAIFGCVLLHELGHALMARRFGVKAREIVLLPIGGVAQLDTMPREPRQEFLITVAGPLVNVVIALVIVGVMLGFEMPIVLGVEAVSRDLSAPGGGLGVFLRQILEVNIFMVLFNLIPAFPMDGGRILRSALASFLEHSRATRIAATVGQGFAVLFGLLGLFAGNLLLVLVAVFVFLGAAGEASMAQLQSIFRGLPVSSGMIHDFRTLGRDDTLGHAIDLLLGGSQVDFPILESDRVLGILTRQQLVVALREKGPDTLLRDISLKEVEAVSASAPLFSAWEQMSKQGVACLPVVEGGAIAGWITGENIAELAMVREALKEYRTHW